MFDFNEEEQAKTGYYDVKVSTNVGIFVHRVYAASDYAAAVKVRDEFGSMPESQHDVEFVAATAGFHA